MEKIRSFVKNVVGINYADIGVIVFAAIFLGLDVLGFLKFIGVELPPNITIVIPINSKLVILGVIIAVVVLKKSILYIMHLRKLTQIETHINFDRDNTPGFTNLRIFEPNGEFKEYMHLDLTAFFTIHNTSEDHLILELDGIKTPLPLEFKDPTRNVKFMANRSFFEEPKYRLDLDAGQRIEQVHLSLKLLPDFTPPEEKFRQIKKDAPLTLKFKLTKPNGVSNIKELKIENAGEKLINALENIFQTYLNHSNSNQNSSQKVMEYIKFLN